MPRHPGRGQEKTEAVETATDKVMSRNPHMMGNLRALQYHNNRFLCSSSLCHAKHNLA